MSETALPPLLAQNPRLDQWVGFPEPGIVRVATGRVEIGQGVLTAMLQIAADELDVAPARIRLDTGDTNLTPNEGYTAGSQSIQFGGVAMRLALAEVRALFLGQAAAASGHESADLAVRDGSILHRGAPTGHDYWSLAASVDLARNATGAAAPKKASERRVIGTNAARVDLAAKVFGQAIFIHDMALDGMVHARVVRQPRRGATVAAIDEAAIRRAAKGPVDIVRHGNFVAIIGPDETGVDAAAAVAPSHVTWDGLDPINPFQEEARWLLQQPTIDQSLGPAPPATPIGPRREASFSRMHIAHASIGPSCGLAVYRDGKLEVWTHSQGVYPLRAALARTLKLDPAVITVHHAQGPGCYGHNGADDAAADAAAIAMLRPNTPIRVRWRREEEFGWEPVSPSMVVSVQAALDEAGRPADWTTEIWSGRHGARPGGGGNLLAAEALPDPPPAPPPNEAPGPPGAGTRNGMPLYDFAQKRILHHLIAETPVRTSSLRGLGATVNVFAIESMLDELAEDAGEDPVAYRLSQLADPRARAVIEKVAEMSGWRTAGVPPASGKGRGIGFAQYKNMAAYCAVVAEVEVEESVRVTHVWCAADSGLVINPDGAINQLEGGVVQGISWALKEGVRLDQAGIASRDWESYLVVKFSDIPEIFVELIDPHTDNPPLGIGEASGAPTVAAIGNAVARALGTRLRDLPLTRDRIMSALLKA